MENYPAGSRAARDVQLHPGGGIYSERVTTQAAKVGDRFVRLATEHGLSPTQLALLWVKDQEGITAPLVGPRTLEQLEHILPVMDMELDDSVRAACDELVPPGTNVANFFNTALWGKQRTSIPTDDGTPRV